MREFVLDASFALRWCFEDEATPETETLLTVLQDEAALAWVPAVWHFEILNGLGKGISRARLSREKGFSLWQEINELPIRTLDIPIGDHLLELALRHNLAVYDACYLSLAQTLSLAIATVDGKLSQVAQQVGVEVIKP